VDHLHEVAGTVGPAVEVTVLGRARLALAPRGAPGRLHAGRQAGENRIEPLDRGIRAAQHQAVPPIQAEDPATGAAVDVVDSVVGERLRAADVVAVIGVAAVDDRVALVELVRDVVDYLFGDGACGNHRPDRPRGLQLRGEVLERVAGHRPLTGQGPDRLRRAVPDDALVTAAHQPPDHVRSHPPQADHSELRHRRPS
jgi:hypothetical protein